ncbi:sugar MFS transporter [Ekhidna sp.]|uniref:sugar MFS transporter n=1 Tax=Ekhidna sp. TaxID=2608089 RepID=UPI003B50BF1B
MANQKYGASMFYMVVLFFTWGFLTELDGALIPYLKGLFDLNNFQAALVQFAFFIAFFCVSLPSSWLLNKIGYHRGIIVGLLIMAIGSWLFYPAASLISYPFFLGAIFVLASGVTLLQVAANPYVARLGDPSKASNRLNLAQGFNSVAKVIAPLAGSYFILRGLAGLSSEQQAEAVQIPYILLGTLLLTLAIIFSFLKLPEVVEVPESDQADSESIWKKTHLVKGAVAIFLYVGAEVTIASFLVIYLSENIFPYIAEYESYVSGLPSKDDQIAVFREIGARYLPFYWGGLMVGRLLGFYILKYISSHRLLMLSAMICIVLMLVFNASGGYLAMWLLIGTGLFLSIMWSNIFTLAIADLGSMTSKGSAVLVAAIVGGALIPPLQGLIADSSFGLHNSFLITIGCFAYIAWYGWKGYKHKS